MIICNLACLLFDFAFHFMKIAFNPILRARVHRLLLIVESCLIEERDVLTRPCNSRLFAGPDAKVVGSSRTARPIRNQAALRPGTMVTGSAAPAVWLLDAKIFICDQSYRTSRPQSRQITYVSVTETFAVLRHSLPLTVMGKLHRL